ncbi:MAG: hypothetical protein C5B52_08540 [Bacteroidetes bacterium]|nr:MAG: hypothetical protein C5B52_08540 [Bacteroidota bacterium]
MATAINDINSMGRFIPVDEARALTARFRAEKEIILKPEYEKMDLLPICESFSRDNIEALLGFDGCVGIRVYLGMDDKLQVRIILTAFDESFQDILPDVQSTVAKSSVASQTNGGTVEDGARCPDICPNPPL